MNPCPYRPAKWWANNWRVEHRHHAASVDAPEPPSVQFVSGLLPLVSLTLPLHNAHHLATNSAHYRTRIFVYPPLRLHTCGGHGRSRQYFSASARKILAEFDLPIEGVPLPALLGFDVYALRLFHIEVGSLP